MKSQVKYLTDWCIFRVAGGRSGQPGTRLTVGGEFLDYSAKEITPVHAMCVSHKLCDGQIKITIYSTFHLKRKEIWLLGAVFCACILSPIETYEPFDFHETCLNVMPFKGAPKLFQLVIMWQTVNLWGGSDTDSMF